MSRAVQARVLLLGLVLLTAAPAHAMPVFARKYGTSCQTCHTVYPKLNPFGEAFRRRGYRFPGVDADAVKQEPVPLGQEAQAALFPHVLWPGTLSAVPPVAVGFDGQAVAHPDVHSGGGQADHGAPFSLRDLVGAVHLWAGGAFDQTITFLAEVTFSSARSFEVETARVLFNDLVGPADLVNLVVGRGRTTLTSFGPNSSYLADLLLPSPSLPGAYGATSDTFTVGDNTAGVELNGIAWSRLGWALGLNAGTNLDLRPTENVTAHLGYKLGGLGLDGSPATEPDPAAPPGSETALTVDLFGAHTNSRFSSAAGTPTQDTMLLGGGGLRAQWHTVELNAGAWLEQHNHAQADNAPGTANGATLLVQYDELSWQALPWLVPAVRLEYTRATPAGGASVWDLRVLPGVVALVRPNLKLSLVGWFETASGAPAGGWSQAGGFAVPTAARPVVGFENEAVQLRLATAF